MTVTIRNVPRDRRVERAFTKSLAKTPVTWSCIAGMHRPEWSDAWGRWVCAACRLPLGIIAHHEEPFVCDGCGASGAGPCAEDCELD